MASMNPCPLAVQDYAQTLLAKKAQLETLLAPFYGGQLDLMASQADYFRNRMEFRIWFVGDTAHYAMFEPGTRTPILLDTCPWAVKPIAELMPKLLLRLKQDDELYRKLFEIDFMASSQGEVLVSLIYRRPLDEPWAQLAKQAAVDLGVHILGRARKQKLVLTQDYVLERFTVAGQEFVFKQIENTFSQPNGGVNVQMVNWVYQQLQSLPPVEGDLCEMYGGYGNFSQPLARCFPKVFMTEIARPAVQAGLWAQKINGISNMTLAPLAAETLVQMMAEGCTLDYQGMHFDFGTLLVDPPRAGLGAAASWASRFDQVVYISCNPQTLVADLAVLCRSHQVVAAALFDQFPYSHHVEAGVILRKKP